MNSTPEHLTWVAAVAAQDQAYVDYERVRSVLFPRRAKVNKALAKYWRLYDAVSAAYKLKMAAETPNS